MPFAIDESGNVILNPLLGWDCSTGFGMLIILQLRFIESDLELLAVMAKQKPPRSVQLGMTPAQCRELAAVLLHQAGRLEAPPPKNSGH